MEDKTTGETWDILEEAIQLEELKRELDLKHCSFIPQSRQLYLLAKIDTLQAILVYHPTWEATEG